MEGDLLIADHGGFEGVDEAGAWGELPRTDPPMIRCVDLGHQVCPDCDPPDPACKGRFAFWDTVQDAFIELNKEQVWHSLADLAEAYDLETEGRFLGDSAYWHRLKSLYEGMMERRHTSNSGDPREIEP